MRLHTDTPRISMLTRYFGISACPYCGDMLLAPMRSEFVDGGEIRHHWSCESCGGVTETSIEPAAGERSN